MDDLPMPYEITSDQDVASMFVIPTKDAECSEKSPEYCFKDDKVASQTQEECQMETSLQTNSNFNPTDLLTPSHDFNSSVRPVLNTEPKEVHTDEEDMETNGEIKQMKYNVNCVKSTKNIQPSGIVNDANPQRKQFNIPQRQEKQIVVSENQNDNVAISTKKVTGIGKSSVSLPLNTKARNERGITLASSKSQGTLQCPTCRYDFPLNADLTRHHCVPPKDGEDILSCTICKTSFDEMDKLKDHMRKHWESLPYKCHVCSERYWTEKSLKRHLIKHETRDKPFACVECNAKYVHKRQLLLHMANVHSRDRAARKYPCDICGRNFLRKCDLTKHVKKCVDLEEESPLLERDNSPMTADSILKGIEKTSVTKDSSDSTNKLLLPNSQPSESETEHQCAESNSETKMPEMDRAKVSQPAEKESTKEENNFLVPGAAIPTSNLMSILSSIQGSGIPAIVPFFNTNGLGQNMLASPLISMLPLLPAVNFVGQNPISNSSSTTVASSPATSSVDTTAPPSVGLSSWRKSKQPRRTISTLLSDLPSKSDMGEKLVDVVEIIRRSKKLARAEDKAPDPKEGALYNCQVCSKSFPTLSELQLHCASHGSNVFSCKYCKKVLSSQVSLYRHEADHEDNRPFKCDLCDKAFVLKAELNRHIDIQHSKRPFTCNICRFNFSCQANLDAHMPVHIEKRACPLCPRSFTTETYLQRHLAKHHDIVEADTVM